MKVGSILALLIILVALGVYFLFFRPIPPPEPPPEPRYLVWYVNFKELQHIVINLPQEDMSESFVKHEDRQWYFDEPEEPKADPQYWGGIALILSGPGADRLIAADATEERLAAFGLTQPRMEIVLTLENDDIVHIEVGDSTPVGDVYYVKLANSTDVYTVDHTWYDVLERLVLEPPYLPPEEE